MTTQDEGIQYTELFAVIQQYATMDRHHQQKALSLITDNFTPFQNLPMEQSRMVIDQILEQHNYLFWYGGRPSLIGVDAVVTVAKWGDQIDWGIAVLWKMIAALAEKPSPHYEDEIRSVLNGIQALREFLANRI